MTSPTESGIEDRLAAVRARVKEAARAAGRAGAVRLVAVSKGQPAEAIRAAYEAGQRDFGENYVQELGEKADALSGLEGLRFHFIGHLQRNKARHVVRVAQAVHSVDSVALAEELGKRAAGLEVPIGRRAFGDDARLPVLVELSIAGEAQKSGVAPADLRALLDAVERQAALRLVGLMAVPPFAENAAASRVHFDALARLREEHGGAARLPELSMGMTGDFEEAIAAGATVVRIGSAIFGPRPARREASG
jgi:pyridoxal phosphate enzyme (YggS family)